MSNHERLKNKLLDAGIDSDTATKAAELITSCFYEAGKLPHSGDWTLGLADDFAKLYALHGAAEALRVFDEKLIK